MRSDDPAVIESARAAPVLQRFRDLVELVGDGRRLTKAGYLPPADGRFLMERWGTADDLHPFVRRWARSARSSGEMPEIDFTLRWAREAGVLRLLKGRLLVTKLGDRIDREPVAVFDRAVHALLRLGALDRVRGISFGWERFLDDAVANLLVSLHRTGPLAMVDLVATAVVDVEATFVYPNDTLDWSAFVADDVHRIFDTLELAGIAEVDVLDGEEVLVLTLAGAAFAQTYATVHETPTSTMDVSRVTAGALLEIATGLDDDDLALAFQVWLAERSDEDAARELVEAMRQSEDFDEHCIALIALDLLGDAAVPAVREAIDDPRVGVLMQFWLVEHGFDEVDSLSDRAMLEVLTGVLAAQLQTDGPRAVVRQIERFGSPDRQREVVDLLRAHRDEHVIDALDAIGRHHPDKTVAKAARKSALRLRSQQRAAASSPEPVPREGRFRPRS